MKILWVWKKYLDTAPDKATALEMLQSLVRQGHDARLLTGYRRKREPFGLGGRIAYVPSSKRRGLNHLTQTAALGAALAERLQRTRPDWVMIDPAAAFAAVPFARLARRFALPTRFVLDVRTMPVELHGALGRLEARLFEAALREAGRWFDGVTAVSPFMARVLGARYDLPAERLGVWTSGVSLDQFDPSRHDEAARARLRGELGLGDRMVVLYHGSLLSERGLSQSIQALRLVRDRVPDLTLVLLGSGSAREGLQAEAARLGLAQQVRILDAVPYDAVALYVASADAGLIPWPDRLEYRVGSPVKLMEYLAMGKPVLVTEIEAHRDVLGAAPYAFYAATNEPAELGAALAALHASGREELARLGQAGRDLACARLTWDEQARVLTSFLGSLRSQRTAHRAWRTAAADVCR